MSREEQLAALALSCCGNDRDAAVTFAEKQIELYRGDAGDDSKHPRLRAWSGTMRERWNRAKALLGRRRPAAPPVQIGMFESQPEENK